MSDELKIIAILYFGIFSSSGKGCTIVFGNGLKQIYNFI